MQDVISLDKLKIGEKVKINKSIPRNPRQVL